MDLIAPAVEQYLSRASAVDDPLLSEMHGRARENNFPIVGPLVGRLLHQLAQLTGARRILELGSGFGYSAYWFASALDEGSELVLTEFSSQNLGLARQLFERAEMRCRISFHQGDALEIVRNLTGEFDIVFNDVDKYQYPEVFYSVADRVRKGGLLISDNVLWHGRVLQASSDDDTRGILEYTRLIFESPDFFSSIIPLRDGVSISLKR